MVHPRFFSPQQVAMDVEEGGARSKHETLSFRLKGNEKRADILLFKYFAKQKENEKKIY